MHTNFLQFQFLAGAEDGGGAWGAALSVLRGAGVGGARRRGGLGAAVSGEEGCMTKKIDM